MLGTLVWMLVAGFLLALAPGRATGSLRAGRRPARPRGCADRPEELLEQLYGRLAAGVLSAFHHTLQLGPREQARNASCPAGGRPADRRFRPPTNLRSVSPWAYSSRYAFDEPSGIKGTGKISQDNSLASLAGAAASASSCNKLSSLRGNGGLPQAGEERTVRRFKSSSSASLPYYWLGRLVVFEQNGGTIRSDCLGRK
ncbi:interleukin-17D isoform X2 [Cynocephalus volans]|uniref:interleukin-17D isoform X2 n=1 Tax=Cynocephalus volans TaxID=110931 RepID=UPI002FC6CAE3